MNGRSEDDKVYRLERRVAELENQLAIVLRRLEQLEMRPPTGSQTIEDPLASAAAGEAVSTLEMEVLQTGSSTASRSAPEGGRKANVTVGSDTPCPVEATVQQQLANDKEVSLAVGIEPVSSSTNDTSLSTAPSTARENCSTAGAEGMPSGLARLAGLVEEVEVRYFPIKNFSAGALVPFHHRSTDGKMADFTSSRSLQPGASEEISFISQTRLPPSQLQDEDVQRIVNGCYQKSKKAIIQDVWATAEKTLGPAVAQCWLDAQCRDQRKYNPYPGSPEEKLKQEAKLRGSDDYSITGSMLVLPLVRSRSAKLSLSSLLRC